MAPPAEPPVLKGVTAADFSKPSARLAAQCRDVAKQLYEQQSAVAVGLPPDAPLPEVTVAATGSCGRAGGVPIGALCKLATGPDVDDQMLWRALELRSGPLGRWLRNELLVAEKLTTRAAARRAARVAKPPRGGPARGVTWAPSADGGAAAAAGNASDDGDGSGGSDSDASGGDGSDGDGANGDSDGSGGDGSGSDGAGSGSDGAGGDDVESGDSGIDDMGDGMDGLSGSDGSGSSSDVDADTARARRRAVAFESASDSDGDGDAAAAARTPLAAARAARASKLAAVEAASVGTKPWQLRGEVGSRDRPADSLLAADLEHDVARRPAAPPSTVTTAAIEALLRRRIADAHWDDVAVPVRPTEALAAAAGEAADRDGPAEVSQQKPTEGLGDLYAAEYVAGRERLAAAAAADGTGGGAGAGASGVATAPPPVTESPEQAEVNAQWRALCRKLDLLANLRLPPKEVARTGEDAGRPDNAAAGLPALAAEDVVPEGVSDATLLAPQEVHQPATAAPAGERERTKEERAAARRRKKRRSGGGGGGGKARPSVVFGADVMGGGGGGGGGGGRKRGRADGGDGGGGGGAGGAGKPKKARATSSAAFFRGMQETVAADIQRKKDKAEGRGVSKATMGSAAKFMR